MPKRIVFNPETRDQNVYYLEESFLDGKEGSIVVKQDTEDYDLELHGVPEEYHELLTDLANIIGVDYLRVADRSIMVCKLVTSDWGKDGIHEEVLELLAGGESMEVSMLKDRNFRSIGNRQEEPINTFEDDLVFRVIAHALNGNKVRADSLEIRQEKGRCTECGGGIDRLTVKIEFG